MNFILKLRHWEVFIIILISSFAMDLQIEGEQIIMIVINTIGYLIFLLWYLLVGLALADKMPTIIKLSSTLFLFNACFLIISIIILRVLFDGNLDASNIFEFLWVAYIMFAMVQFLVFPSKALKSFEIGTKASFAQYVGYFLLTLFLPIGIWWIQPKLNRIATAGNIRDSA